MQVLAPQGGVGGLVTTAIVQHLHEIGQQHVVVKNLEANYRKVAGISGATILGDGGVSLILDVAALVRSSRHLADEALAS